MFLLRQTLLLVFLGMLTIAVSARAQNTGGPGGRGGPPPRPPDPLQQIKSQMGVSEDEWTVMLPLIQRVQELERDSHIRGRGPGGRGGPPPPPPDGRGGPPPPPPPVEPPTELQLATLALQELIANDNATSDQIFAAIESVRVAHEKAQAALKEAQDQLKQLLTAKQEAVLTLSGLLN
jgi:hypothetical protein